MPKFIAENIHATGAPVACYRNRAVIAKDIDTQTRAYSRKSSQLQHAKTALGCLAKKRNVPTFACFVNAKLVGLFTRLPNKVIVWQDYYPNSGNFGKPQRVVNRTHGLSHDDVLELVCSDSGNVIVRRIA